MQVIKYKLNCTCNTSIEEAPVLVENLLIKAIPYTELNEEIAKREAYNGEYTVEDVESDL